MKKTHDNLKSFNCQFIRSLARVIDEDSKSIKLYRKNVCVAIFKPKTNEYITRKDIIRRYRCEEYIKYNLCTIQVNNDLKVIFDEFEEVND